MSDDRVPMPIHARGLSKTYRLGFFLNRQVKALRALDFEVPPGTIYGLLGPNGAGKSTTIKILLNLVRASSGTATLFGLPAGHPDVARRVGFVPENPAPYDYLTGQEFLSLSGTLAGISGQDLHQRIKEVLGVVDLPHAAGLQVRRYSKGMVQRLALAHGLLTRPSLLILDEPTSGLDPIGRRQIRDIILEQRARGTTVLLCTHIIPDVEAVCDRLAILVGGRRIKEGPVRDLLAAASEHLDLVVDDAGRGALDHAGVAALTAHPLGDRWAVRIDGGQRGRALEAIVKAGGNLYSLTSQRPGVEELFMAAVREAGRTVGSEVE